MLLELLMLLLTEGPTQSPVLIEIQCQSAVPSYGIRANESPYSHCMRVQKDMFCSAKADELRVQLPEDFPIEKKSMYLQGHYDNCMNSHTF